MDIQLMFCNAFLVLLFILPETLGIQCYECDSIIKQSECGGNFGLSPSDTDYVVNGCNRCLRRITTQGNQTTYSRECSSALVSGCITVSANEVQCFCDTDLCNQSNHVTLSLVTILMNIVLYLSLK